MLPLDVGLVRGGDGLLQGSWAIPPEKTPPAIVQFTFDYEPRPAEAEGAEGSVGSGGAEGGLRDLAWSEAIDLLAGTTVEAAQFRQLVTGCIAGTAGGAEAQAAISTMASLFWECAPLVQGGRTAFTFVCIDATHAVSGSHKTPMQLYATDVGSFKEHTDAARWVFVNRAAPLSDNQALLIIPDLDLGGGGGGGGGVAAAAEGGHAVDAPAAASSSSVEAAAHIARFCREGEVAVVDRFWQRLGTTLQTRMLWHTPEPLWVLTDGWSVKYLHCHIRFTTKYTKYAPFCAAGGPGGTHA